MADARKPRRRWWELQLEGSPRNGYVLGSLILVCGVGQLVLSMIGTAHVWSVVMGVYFTLWGLLMLLGARAKSRDVRAADTSADQQGPT
jgi:hypothetical protein